MKHVVYVLFIASFLAACAGNPPTWWNPQNRYGKSEGTPVTTGARPVHKSVIKEESIEVADTSYEEESIDPLPEEEAPAALAVQHETTLPTPSVLE